MALRDEFKAFILRGNVVDLAVGVVIGGAFGKIIGAFVDGLIMPIVGLVTPQGDWKTIEYMGFKFGAVMGATIDFLLIAMVVFFVFVKGLGRLQKSLEKPAEPAAPEPPTKECPFCLEKVPAAAKRCKHCTSELPEAAAA